jgi:glycosyltransferase involved in cell wall biosynthesis
MLVHAARQEPLGRVLLEGAACGTPIIATDVGGTREIFPEAAQAAIVVPGGSAEHLAEAIANLSSDVALRRELGTAARRRAVEAFDAQTAAASLAEHYHAIMSSPVARSIP